MKKWAIVVDRLDSGLGIAAVSRAQADSSIDVIAALDFPFISGLIKRLEDTKYQTILFSWRYLLSEITKDVLVVKRLNTLRSDTRIGVLIPDYQGLSLEQDSLTQKEIFLLQHVDFYHVTNIDLAKKYMRLLPNIEFAGTFHDLPSLKSIRSVRDFKLPADDYKLIWVGNSKWGNRSGFTDHKGLDRIVKPLQVLLECDPKPYRLEIIDSANHKLDNDEVLERIARSSYLILCSEHEGTGLPVLEALGLGTKVISTNVGITPELSQFTNSLTIAENTPESFYEILKYGKLNASREDVISVFENYVTQVGKEQISSEETLQGKEFPMIANPWRSLLTRVKWVTRYFKNLYNI
jgi:glycosyltransferase involved in cell wall biosynthesis